VIEKELNLKKLKNNDKEWANLKKKAPFAKGPK